MQGRFSYGKLTAYPHMGPRDAVIWEKFIDKYPEIYESVSYDVVVGDGAIPPPEIDDNIYKENFTHLTKFRIDAVGFRPDGSVDIIELRPRAGLSAFGSTLGCCHLFAKKWPLLKCVPVIVTDDAQSDLEKICAAFDVELLELGF